MSLNHEFLLQEEIHRLEDQLKVLREKQWNKEKEWMKENKELQEDNARLQGLLQKTSQPEIFHMIKGNLLSLQDEIEKLREDQKPTTSLTSSFSASPSFSLSHLSRGDEDILNPLRYIGERAGDRYSALAMVPPPTADSFKANGGLPHDGISFLSAGFKSGVGASSGRTDLSTDALKSYQKAVKENAMLRAELVTYKKKVRKLDSLLDGKNVECRELEVKVASLQKKVVEAGCRSHSSDPKRSPGRSSSDTNYQQSQRTLIAGSALLEEEIKQLRNSLSSCQGTSQDFKRRCEDLQCHNRTLQSEINYLRSQVDEIKNENKEVGKLSEDHIDTMKKEKLELNDENEDDSKQGLGRKQSSSAMSSVLGDVLLQFSRDRRECLNEMMRQLEQQWAMEDPLNSNAYYLPFPPRQWSLCPTPVAIPAPTTSAVAASSHTRGSTILCTSTEESPSPKKENSSSECDSAMRVTDLHGKRKLSKPKERKVSQGSQKVFEGEEKEEEAPKRLPKENGSEKSCRDGSKKRKGEENRGYLESTSSSFSPSLLISRSPSIVVPEEQTEEHLVVEKKHFYPKSDRRGEEEGHLPCAVEEGAHLCVTIIQVEELRSHGQSLTQDSGEVFIKLKSLKEKYKTSLRPFSRPAVHFGEAFQFYLAQPHQDVISLHVYFKSHSVPPREYHIGDCCFSLQTLFKGIPRERRAPIVENAATPIAVIAGTVTVQLRTDDFGVSRVPTAKEIEDEQLRFQKRVELYQKYAPEKLHTVDVFMATEPVPNMLL